VPQTEQEYIGILRKRLVSRMPKEITEDIISDYSEHFRIGKEKGRSEEDLCLSLGSPDDAARELIATHFVNKAGETQSYRNFWHAILATLGLGLFNLVFVLVPFILLIALLGVIALTGVLFTALGPAAFVMAILQLVGFPIFAIWFSPLAGVFLSIGITSLGLLLIIGDFYLAHFFYHLGIRYLKWNIAVIKGTGEAL
jgi:uncharacterized membrane protein